MIVATTGGQVRGADDGGVLAFRGIPYATAERFGRPEPTRWPGVRDALDFGPACPQTPHVLAPDIAAVLGRYDLPAQDEDCLHLNVWTAGTEGARPVLVWIHGGNFTWGSSADPLTWGDRLAARGDVVVVSVDHRLGVLGFLGDDNLGMLDLVAALAWVRDNIAAFGGDPDRVTIFGMSSGGMKIAALLAMPSARGLFHRAISQSGPGLRGIERADAARFREAFLAALDDDPRRASVADLLRAQDEVLTGSPVDGGVQLGPVVDGDVLPSHPVDARSGVPMLVGTNRDELALMLLADPRYAPYAGAETDDDVCDRLARLTPEADRLLRTYREQRPAAPPASLLAAVLSDRMRLSAIALATSPLPSTAHLYLFAFPSPMLEGRVGAFHGLEMPFVFDCIDRSPMTGGGADAQAVAAAMSDARVAFAREGDPGWPAYVPDERATMVFDVEPRVELDPGGAERRVLEELGLGWT